MNMSHTHARCKDIYVLQPECDVVKVCILTSSKNSRAPQINTGCAIIIGSLNVMPFHPLHNTDQVALLRTDVSASMTQV